MPRSYDALKAGINVAADAAGGLLELVLGTPGGVVTYPDPTEFPGVGVKSYARGTLWSSVVIPTILQRIGARMDEDFTSWASIQTNATGVAPVYLSQYGFDAGTAIIKNEGNNTIQLAFDSEFTDAYYAVNGSIEGDQAVVHVHTKSASLIVVEYQSLPSGLAIGINDQICQLVCVGARS